MNFAFFRSLLRCAAVPLALSFAAPAAAEEPLPADGLVAPGALLIDGAPVDCGDTPALVSDRYPDYGAARPGLIILNPLRLKPLPPTARLLIYYHECAHQYVGRSELDADCWAVQTARRRGRLSRGGLQDACRFVDGLAGNEHHPPGALRCAHMTRCYDDTYRVKAETPGTSGGRAAGSEAGFSGSFADPPRPTVPR